MRQNSAFLFLFASICAVPGCSSLPGGTTKNVTVSISPLTATVNTFGKQTFTPTVSGTTNTGLIWQVNGVTGGNATTGTISTAGVYSAPHFISGSIIPSNGNATVTVTATSQVDSLATGKATITLMTQGQAAQSGAVELGTSGGNIHSSSQSGNTITCCGGTLGALVVRNGTDFVLSNNHVLADSDAGTVGDAISQPGIIDNPAPNTCTSTGTTTVANLSQFFTLEGSPANPVDAAIAQIVSGKVDTSGSILLLGSSADANGVPVAGAPNAGSGVAASVGMAVAKSGRSSGLTCSTIETTPATFSVQYSKTCGGATSFTVMYSNQVGVTGGDFSQEGDSGSLIVTQNTADAVALLFAGSDTDTVGNPIGEVLNAMQDGSGHVPTIVGGAAHQVIGCTLPGPSSATRIVASMTVAESEMQSAIAARDANSEKLLALPGVKGIGVGQSLDSGRNAAVLLFVAPGTAHSTLPAQVDGVRTRIVETANESARGILNAGDAQALLPQGSTIPVTSLSAAEFARGKAAHAAHVSEWMKQPGVQGFGVSASADSVGEAALMIYLIRGEAHNPIPAIIGGVRTKVRESSRFHAGFSHTPMRAGCAVLPSKPEQAKIAASVPSAK
jgi:hypothetical protein